MVGYASYRRAFSHGGPAWTGVTSALRSGLRSRVELIAGRSVGRVWRVWRIAGTGGSLTPAAALHGAAPTSRASSGSAGAEGAFDGTPETGGRISTGGGPPASRSAALPARPWPSEPRLARKSGASPGDPARLAVSPAAPVAPATPVAPAAPDEPPAHGGGAAQSRGGFRRASSSSASRSEAPASPGPSSEARAASTSATGLEAEATMAPPTPASPTVPATDRACAASRRAQAWNVGQTGKALERQYASWWASARAAGRTSA